MTAPLCKDCQHSEIRRAGWWRFRRLCKLSYTDGFPWACVYVRLLFPGQKFKFACGPEGTLFEKRRPWWRRMLLIPSA